MLRPAKFSLLITLLLIFIASPSANADPYSSTQLETLNYNLGIIMGGADFYYRDTGTMPASVADLLEAGWIPTNLRNPITDGSFNYYATGVNGGEIVIDRINGDQCAFMCLSPMGTEFEFLKNSSDVDLRPPTGPHLQMCAYRFWLQESLFWYWNLNHDIPGSMEELKSGGYWPFDGTEMNPYTSEPLLFNGSNPGDFYFSSDKNAIRFTVHFENDRIGFASLDREQIEDVDHF